MFFITALYLQQVHGDSALDAGVHFLPMGVAAIASRPSWARSSSRAYGTRAAYVGGSRRSASSGCSCSASAGADAGYQRRPAPRPGRLRPRAAAGRRRPTRSPRSPRSRTTHAGAASGIDHRRVPDRRRGGARARLERRDLARRRRARRRGRAAGCPRGGLPARDARGSRHRGRQPADRRDPRAAHHARRGARRGGRRGLISASARACGAAAPRPRAR